MTRQTTRRGTVLRGLMQPMMRKIRGLVEKAYSEELRKIGFQ